MIMMDKPQQMACLTEAIDISMRRGWSFFGLAKNSSLEWKVMLILGEIKVVCRWVDDEGTDVYKDFSPNDIFFDPDLAFLKWFMDTEDEEELRSFMTHKFLFNKGRMDVIKGIITRQNKK